MVSKRLLFLNASCACYGWDETVCQLMTGVLRAEDADLQAHLDGLSAAGPALFTAGLGLALFTTLLCSEHSS